MPRKPFKKYKRKVTAYHNGQFNGNVRFNLKIIRRRHPFAWGTVTSESYAKLKRTGVILPKHGDFDGDGVENYKDCQPLNPKRQHNPFLTPEAVVAMTGMAVGGGAVLARRIHPKVKKFIKKYDIMKKLEFNVKSLAFSGAMKDIRKKIKKSTGLKRYNLRRRLTWLKKSRKSLIKRYKPWIGKFVVRRKGKYTKGMVYRIKGRTLALPF